MSQHTQEKSNRLFQAYQDGDTAALGELYRLWHGYVAQRIGRSHAFGQSEIEDISSNVWVLVQQRVSQWDISRSGWCLFLKYQIKTAISREMTRRTKRQNILESKGYYEMSEVMVNVGGHPEPLNNSRTLRSSLYIDPAPSALESIIASERWAILEKAIRICEFAPITEKILRLRLGGMKIDKIQEALGLKQSSCVNFHLKRAFEDLKEVINPETYEVSQIAPKKRRKQEKKEYLRRAGRKLKQCFQRHAFDVETLSRAVKIHVNELEGYFAGKSKPQAPRLKRLASVFGDVIYDIYLPPLHSRWSKQGQEFWRMRVKQGITLKKLSNLTGIHCAVLAQYEAGEMKMSAAVRAVLSKIFTAD